ncbi:UDP-N-acetylglucosamine 2-epimerase (non-hydrolyzing) [Clostridiaceae bacterium HSG29]|nr:UDP-N-acetylglucosamine 2-epimerase (non-hydrolyzing) [Clostridiaceae bacterium HSG29]
MKEKIKIMTIFGTRPEAIKMAPVVKVLKEDPMIELIVCVSAQHREMLDQVLKRFSIIPDYDLDIMEENQTLSKITSKILLGLEEVFKVERPNMILVHGDTTTTLSATLAAFYNGIDIGHVEAGLRSGDLYSPYPEEANRALTGRIANIHFSPTDGNVSNLIKENISKTKIIKTGNTVIDALVNVVKNDYVFKDESLNKIDYKNKKVILLTAHRRENLGEPMENIFKAVKRLILENDDVELIFPMHLNPKVRLIARKYLEGNEKIHLIEPLDYEPFANLMNKSYLILTDSGGIQEEAPALGKPVLVLRTETERPEAVEAGTVEMVGINEEFIFIKANELINNSELYQKMSNAVNPYGDGKASLRIVDAIKKHYSN